MTAPHEEAQKDPAGGEVLDVVVVGGSQAGLAMAWHLQRQGLNFVVLEAGPEVGHVWRSRWDSLKRPWHLLPPAASGSSRRPAICARTVSPAADGPRPADRHLQSAGGPAQPAGSSSP